MFNRIPNPYISTFSDAVSIEMGDYTTIQVSGQVGNDAAALAKGVGMLRRDRSCNQPAAEAYGLPATLPIADLLLIGP